MVKYRKLNFETDTDEVVRMINENLNLRHNRYMIEWKHLRNPFRKSKGIVATKEEKIVGVVIYIEYSFQKPDGSFMKIGRPVEGCVDRAERGQRIFKALMAKSIEPYLEDYDLFFANPNHNSYPEFLKIGWSELKGFHYYVGLSNPLKKSGGKLSDVDFSAAEKKIDHSHNFYISAVDLNFIAWRYEGDEYHIKQFQLDEKNSYIIYRKVKVKGLSCIVLCDFSGYQPHISEAINSLCKAERIFVVYYLKNRFAENLNFVWEKRYKPAVITYLNNNAELTDELVLSLGDLEGKI